MAGLGEDEPDASDDGLSSKVCAHCNKGGLYWTKTDAGWRLADDNGIHSCPQFFNQQEYRCYSDASCDSALGLAGYAVVITLKTGGKPEVFRRFSSTLRLTNSVEAEIVAIVRGLKCIPADSTGFVYTDMVALPTMLARPRKKNAGYQHVLKQLQNELKRTKLLLVYSKKKNRSHHYTECHRLANKIRLRKTADLKHFGK